MRLLSNSSSENIDEIHAFGSWMLDVGDGKLGDYNDGEADIMILDELLIYQSLNPIEHIVRFTYNDMDMNMSSLDYYQDKTILAPTFDVVDAVNQYIMSSFPGVERTYLSCDKIWKVDDQVGIEADWIRTEFLNDIRSFGIPDHKLVLKEVVPIMLMRNLDISSGLCNGTRLIVTDLCVNFIGAIVMTGTHIDRKVYIQRMNLMSSDQTTPIKYTHRHFPICLAFTMTINKSQGQSLSHVGVYFPKPVFSHGQLYVAISRVKNKDGFKIIVCSEDVSKRYVTKNVVFKEVFQKIHMY